MKEVLLVVALVTATYAAAFRPEVAGTTFLWIFALPHFLLAAFAIRQLGRDGTLSARITPRWGDLTLGVAVSGVLLLASWGARALLVPTGTPRTLWLLMLYAQLGDPDALQRSVLLTVLLIAITFAEELIWRGLVLDRMNERLGPRLGWLAAAALYGLSTLPTVYTMRVEGVGYNPLIAFAAFGCGLTWTFLTTVTGRLLPSALSHAVFSYFSAVQFRLVV